MKENQTETKQIRAVGRKKTATLIVRMSPELKALIDGRAEALEISSAEYIRRIAMLNLNVDFV